MVADKSKLLAAANNIRVLAASMVEKAKSGHPGGAMGGADFINVLYAEYLRYDPEDPFYPFRDRLSLIRVICHRCYIRCWLLRVNIRWRIWLHSVSGVV